MALLSFLVLLSFAVDAKHSLMLQKYLGWKAFYDPFVKKSFIRGKAGVWIPVKTPLNEVNEGLGRGLCALVHLHRLHNTFSPRYSKLPIVIISKQERLIALLVKEQLLPCALIQDPLWWHSAHLHDKCQLLLLIFPWEDWIAGEKFN